MVLLDAVMKWTYIVMMWIYDIVCLMMGINIVIVWLCFADLWVVAVVVLLQVKVV